jgi:hypothetical protein
MRRLAVKTLALALVLGGAGIGLAQQQPGQPGQPPARPGQPGQPPAQPRQPGMPPGGMPGKKKPPEKSKLEEMLAEALKNNPDIRVAAANLALAEAELYRTRLQVTQKVVTLYHAIQSQQATVDFEQKQYDRMQALVKERAIDSRLLDERFAKLAAAKGKLTELEAQMPALLGKAARAAAFSPDGATLATTSDSLRLWDVRTGREIHLLSGSPPTGSLAERMRKALQTPIKVDYKDMTFTLILRDLEKKVEGLSFRNLFDDRLRKRLKDHPTYSIHFEEVLPVSAVLQALADETGCLFFVREYGIVATTREHTPQGAMTVEEFLRHKSADEPRRQSSSGKNPPAENVEGVVNSIDDSGLLTISIGSDAGLAKGHTLELFRISSSAPSKSKYLGTIRILEAKAKESVAQPIGRLASPAQAGDRVASRILGN